MQPMSEGCQHLEVLPLRCKQQRRAPLHVRDVTVIGMPVRLRQLGRLRLSRRCHLGNGGLLDTSVLGFQVVSRAPASTTLQNTSKYQGY